MLKSGRVIDIKLLMKENHTFEHRSNSLPTFNSNHTARKLFYFWRTPYA